MSAEDNDEFMFRTPYPDRESRANEMLNRQGGRDVSEAAKQSEEIKIATGTMEGSGIGAQSVEEERKEDEEARIIHPRQTRQDILGGPLTTSTISDVQGALTDVAQNLGLDVYSSGQGRSITELAGELQNMGIPGADVLAMGAGALETGAGALETITSTFNDVSSVYSDVTGGRALSEDLNFGWIDRMYEDVFGVPPDSVDLNDDGEIDQTELNMAINQTSENNAMLKRIHPLILKSLNTNKFMVDRYTSGPRTIKKEKIAYESPKTRADQTNLVTQGYAAYDKDVNRYNVKY
jgi:hypothetical protein